MLSDVKYAVPHPMARRLGAAAFIVLFATGCQSQQQRITEHEDKLAAAGFVVRPANTPERQEMMHRLPPNKFVMRTKGDEVHYVYADPVVCNCLYVGAQQAYNRYQRDRQRENLATQQQIAAQEYSDAAWNWGAGARGDPATGCGDRAGNAK